MANLAQEVPDLERSLPDSKRIEVKDGGLADDSPSPGSLSMSSHSTPAMSPRLSSRNAAAAGQSTLPQSGTPEELRPVTKSLKSLRHRANRTLEQSENFRHMIANMVVRKLEGLSQEPPPEIPPTPTPMSRQRMPSVIGNSQAVMDAFGKELTMNDLNATKMSKLFKDWATGDNMEATESQDDETASIPFGDAQRSIMNAGAQKKRVTIANQSPEVADGFQEYSGHRRTVVADGFQEFSGPRRTVVNSGWQEDSGHGMFLNQNVWNNDQSSDKSGSASSDVDVPKRQTLIMPPPTEPKRRTVIMAPPAEEDAEDMFETLDSSVRRRTVNVADTYKPDAFERRSIMRRSMAATNADEDVEALEDVPDSVSQKLSKVNVAYSHKSPSPAVEAFERRSIMRRSMAANADENLEAFEDVPTGNGLSSGSSLKPLQTIQAARGAESPRSPNYGSAESPRSPYYRNAESPRSPNYEASMRAAATGDEAALEAEIMRLQEECLFHQDKCKNMNRAIVSLEDEIAARRQGTPLGTFSPEPPRSPLEESEALVNACKQVLLPHAKDLLDRSRGPLTPQEEAVLKLLENPK